MNSRQELQDCLLFSYLHNGMHHAAQLAQVRGSSCWHCESAVSYLLHLHLLEMGENQNPGFAKNQNQNVKNVQEPVYPNRINPTL